ncbi:MAG: DUF1592 domain-containing protein [Pirellulales bacterium]
MRRGGSLANLDATARRSLEAIRRWIGQEADVRLENHAMKPSRLPMPVRIRTSIYLIVACVSFAALRPLSASAQDNPRGQKIYEQLCASCHGKAGEGHPELYPHALVGDKSVGELTQLIERTMPKDEAEKCVGDDARSAAEYIHDAFYSATAQARNKPPRVELARLTVRQYQNTLTDLIGSFRGAGKVDAPPGLRGEYFKSRQNRKEDRVIDRVDRAVKFDFGESSPDAEKIPPAEFSAKWQGAVFAPETGDYEFIVRTENGARLWVNHPQQPLIDAWVRSGNDKEFRQTIRLLGGRTYPLRLEFFKFKEKTSSIELRWRRPHQHVDELITDRNLRNSWFPELYVVSTPFPPDDRSVGYERGSSVSKAWDQAATDAAFEAAAYVVARLNELAGTKADAGDRPAKVQAFAARFVERAFRRPLDEEQRQRYVERQFASAPDLETAVKRVVLLTLKSPRFLYPELSGPQPDSYDAAIRLSYTLWDSLPDSQLLEAAAKGQLGNRDQIQRQAERMVRDPRATAKLAEFFRQWLKIDHAPDVAKDSKLFPDFDEAIAADLRTSLELMVDELLASDASDFRRLLSADELYLNGRLAKYYGADLPDGADFQKVRIDDGQRAGVLSHPYLLASFAYTATSSPIHRGVFISRSLLGRSLRPPPIAVAPLAADLHPDLTTRERVVLQTKPEACQACHNMINPLGFTLEAFDATGRLRREEQGRPIDSSGVYINRQGNEVKFAGVHELAAYLTTSLETRDAFVEQLYHYLRKQPFRAEDLQTQEKLREWFAEKQYSVRSLTVAIATQVAASLPPKEVPAR